MVVDVWHNYADETDRVLIHGTAVCYGQKGLLIVGPSGCGKSSLALRLMAFGCALISDDRVWLKAGGDRALTATAPVQVAGKIEGYGFGVLQSPYQNTANIYFAVDLSDNAEKRWQNPKFTHICGTQIPVYKISTHNDPAPILLHMLRHGYGYRKAK